MKFFNTALARLQAIGSKLFGDKDFYKIHMPIGNPV